MVKVCSVEVFAENLNRYIERSGKSRNEICEAIGVGYSTFSSWCQGLYYPRIDKIEMLANYFHIEKSDLIEARTTADENDGAEDLIKLLRQLPFERRKQQIDLFANQIRMLL